VRDEGNPQMFKQVLIAVAVLLTATFASANAQQPGPSPQMAVKRTVLQKADVPGSNYEVEYALVEIPANTKLGRHSHPGTVFGYLLEGDYTLAIDGQAPKSFKPGETVRIEPNVVHDEWAGSAPAKFLSVFIIEKGKPLAVPAQ
jgi:quercetin dioxygenase-like cupin family protein